MKTFYGYKNIEKLTDPIACIGIFDGIHLGHKKVIQRVLNLRAKNRDKVIITFDPHPQTVLNPGKELPRILSLEHWLCIFDKLGVDAAVVIKFTDAIANMTPEDFIKKVLVKISTRTVYVGENFHFGKGKRGNIKTFQLLGKEYGVDVRVVYSVKKGRKIVSSTYNV
jgi:riboflavin kinase/FMN adenylyltransferase